MWPWKPEFWSNQPQNLRQPSPTPVMLHIKCDQDWPTGFRKIKVCKCGRRRTDDGPLVYYKLTLWAFGSGKLKTELSNSLGLTQFRVLHRNIDCILLLKLPVCLQLHQRTVRQCSYRRTLHLTAAKSIISLMRHRLIRALGNDLVENRNCQSDWFNT